MTRDSVSTLELVAAEAGRAVRRAEQRRRVPRRVIELRSGAAAAASRRLLSGTTAGVTALCCAAGPGAGLFGRVGLVRLVKVEEIGGRVQWNTWKRWSTPQRRGRGCGVEVEPPSPRGTAGRPNRARAGRQAGPTGTWPRAWVRWTPGRRRAGSDPGGPPPLGCLETSSAQLVSFFHFGRPSGLFSQSEPHSYSLAR